jgi:hypothetical protein
VRTVSESDAVRLRGRPAVLDWMARLRVAGVDALAAGMEVTARQIHHHAATLARQGFIAVPGWAMARARSWWSHPRAFASPAASRPPAARPDPWRGLIHGRGVSWIAAHCERRGREWWGPSELREGGWIVGLPPGGRARKHLPDLGFILEGEHWAAEFERVPKTRERLHSIVAGYRTAQLSGELESVLYVCGSPQVERLVCTIADEIVVNLITRSLDRVVHEAIA